MMVLVVFPIQSHRRLNWHSVTSECFPQQLGPVAIRFEGDATGSVKAPLRLDESNMSLLGVSIGCCSTR